MAYYFLNPLALFHSESSNPFNKIIDKVIPQDIFDRFDHLDNL